MLILLELPYVGGMTIHRRKYYVPTPNSLWHIDSGHKLIRYKLITHFCVDGKTRLILYAACRNNNKAETVLSLFQNAVQGWGLPSRVRCDYSMENYHVAAYLSLMICIFSACTMSTFREYKILLRSLSGK